MQLSLPNKHDCTYVNLRASPDWPMYMYQQLCNLHLTMHFSLSQYVIAVVGEPEPFPPTPEDQANISSVVVGGPSLRWFNISRTIILAAAEDPSLGDYTCSVCTGRGTPSQECHNATLTLHLLGAPPTLVRATDNGERMVIVVRDWYMVW